MVVCSRHFDPNSSYIGQGHTTLNEDSIPVWNIPEGPCIDNLREDNVNGDPPFYEYVPNDDTSTQVDLPSLFENSNFGNLRESIPLQDEPVLCGGRFEEQSCAPPLIIGPVQLDRSLSTQTPQRYALHEESVQPPSSQPLLHTESLSSAMRSNVELNHSAENVRLPSPEPLLAPESLPLDIETVDLDHSHCVQMSQLQPSTEDSAETSCQQQTQPLLPVDCEELLSSQPVALPAQPVPPLLRNVSTEASGNVPSSETTCPGDAARTEESRRVRSSTGQFASACYNHRCKPQSTCSRCRALTAIAQKKGKNRCKNSSCAEIYKDMKQEIYTIRQILLKKVGSQKESTDSVTKLKQKLSGELSRLIDMAEKNYGNKKQGRRFTDDEKIQCLKWWKISPRMYRFLRSKTPMPSPRTLSTFVQSLPLTPGPNKVIYDGLKAYADNIKDERKKIAVLVFDEMKFLTHVDYDDSSSLIGMEDWGPLFNLETQEMESTRTCRFADHLIVFMIRTLFDGRKMAIQYGFCHSQTTQYKLVQILKDIVRRLRECGFEIVGFVCDRGTSNVGAINYLMERSKKIRIEKNLPPKGKAIQGR